jgi:hypothetical protein
MSSNSVKPPAAGAAGAAGAACGGGTCWTRCSWTWGSGCTSAAFSAGASGRSSNLFLSSSSCASMSNSSMFRPCSRYQYNFHKLLFRIFSVFGQGVQGCPLLLSFCSHSASASESSGTAAGGSPSFGASLSCDASAAPCGAATGATAVVGVLRPFVAGALVGASRASGSLAGSSASGTRSRKVGGTV